MYIIQPSILALPASPKLHVFLGRINKINGTPLEEIGRLGRRMALLEGAHVNLFRGLSKITKITKIIGFNFFVQNI